VHARVDGPVVGAVGRASPLASGNISERAARFHDGRQLFWHVCSETNVRDKRGLDPRSFVFLIIIESGRAVGIGFTIWRFGGCVALFARRFVELLDEKYKCLDFLFEFGKLAVLDPMQGRSHVSSFQNGKNKKPE